MRILARRAILSWQSWREKRRLHRAYPELRRINAEIARRRKRHAPVADLLSAQRAFMVGVLRGNP